MKTELCQIFFKTLSEIRIEMSKLFHTTWDKWPYIKFLTTTLLSEVYQLSTDLDLYPLLNVAPLHVRVVAGLLDCDGAVVSVSVATVVGAAGGRGRAVVRDGGWGDRHALHTALSMSYQMAPWHNVQGCQPPKVINRAASPQFESRTNWPKKSQNRDICWKKRDISWFHSFGLLNANM